MCVINSFTIGGIPLLTKKGTKAVDTVNPDNLFAYTVTEFSLTEELLQPNEFSFTLRRVAIQKTDKTKSYSVVNSILGKEVDCQVTTSQKKDAQTQFSSSLHFTGKISKVTLKGLNITCVAMSDDADLQEATKCRCFTEKKLYEIVKAVNRHISVQIHSCFDNLVFPYIVQYNESDYDFLVRLAKRFGAFFYYDLATKALVFGKLPTSQVTDVDSSNTAAISYEIEPGDPNYRYVMHEDNKSLDLFTRQMTDLKGNNPQKLYGMAAYNSSDINQDACVDTPYSVPLDPPDTLLDEYNKAMVGSCSAQMGICKFISYLFDIGVGNILKINDNGLMVVTSAHLTWDCNGSPQNEITAMLLPNDNVNDELIFAPYMDLNAYPKSSAQRAVVLNNIDPLKMGRVQVQYIWQINASQQEKDGFPWIRIAQPYGGNQKGCYILPEIGEEVMVGFEHENMEKPFVIGTLYHNSDQDADKQMPDEAWVETANPKANEENEVKAFRTKKGHTIEFHDVKDECGFIRIYNSTKNQKYYDVILSTDQIQVPKPQSDDKEDYKVKGPKTKNIAAGDDIEEADYVAKNLRLMVRSYGGDIVLDAGDGDIIMNAKNIRVHATGDATTLIDQKNIMKVKDGQFVDVGTNSLVAQGKQNIVVKAEETESYSKKVIMNLEQPFVMQGVGQENFQLSIDAKSLTTKTTEKTEITASQSALLKADMGLDLQGGNKAELKATNVTVNGDASATVTAADLTLNGKKSISERAAKVELTSPSSISVRSSKIDLTTPDGSLAGVWKLP